jgi:hypothetical protein
VESEANAAGGGLRAEMESRARDRDDQNPMQQGLSLRAAAIFADAGVLAPMSGQARSLLATSAVLVCV